MISDSKSMVQTNSALFGFSVALIIAVLFNNLPNSSYGSQLKPPGARRFSDINLTQETLPPYIGAANGQAFILKQAQQGIEVIPFETSRPVFKAFGLSIDQKSLLYIPLRNSVPSGELYVEDLASGSARKITNQLVLEAAWSPTDGDAIAYTFSGNQGFGLAMADLRSGRCRTLVANQVLADILQWKDSGEGIYYFQAVADYLSMHLSAHFVSVKSGGAGPVAEPDLPASFPVVQEIVISGPIAENPPEILYSFEYRSPDARYEVGGNSLLGSGPIYVRNLPSGAQGRLADGKLVKVLQKGIVVRSFKGASSTLEFIDWNGRSTSVGAPATIGYNLPLKNPKVTQGGSLYPPPGNCNIVSHGPGFGYAYDLASTNVGEHVLASAEGLVVYAVSTVTCNTIDTDCPDYDSNGCPGTFLGNQVVIQHSDGSYTGYGHMEKYSVQVPVGAAVCQGLYIGRQGHTGSTGGNVIGCGDHLHFQRQSSPDMLAGTLSTSFSDVASNPLSCGTTYTSGSTEFSNAISPASQSFADPGGSGTVNVTSPGGCGWLATSSDSWITITSPGTGIGNDVVSYTVAENTGGLPRAGAMIIAGKSFTVIQDGGGVTNQAPVVNAGPDQTVIIPSSVMLTGTVTDDGLPNPPGTLTISWRQVSGPGTASFADSSVVSTTATFSIPGTYILRLAADDLGLSNSDDVTVAAVTNQAPTITLTGPADGASFTLPVSITISADAADSDGSISKVDFFANGALVGTDTSNPYSITWSNAQQGNYSLTAVATDNLGTSTTSSNPVVVTMNNGNGGSLAASGAIPPGAVNLTSEGGLDWAHWGLTSATSFNHKSGVVQQISNFTRIGSGSPKRVNANPVTYSWTGGTPTASATNTPSGVYVLGINNGFQVTLPADATTKTLKLYLGVWKAQGRLEVSLSDSSAPAYVDTSLDENSAGTRVRVYTISYRAASSGQQLKIKWTLLNSYDTFGNITLQAGTLVIGGGAGTNQAPVVNAGSDQTTTLPSNATLAGTVTDDGLPNPPNVVTTVWSMVSGPGNVTFGNANTVNTTASFSVAGAYVLRLTANDSALSSSDDISITVNPANQAPVVNAGSDQTTTLPSNATLAGTVTDDGLPNPPNVVTTVWSKVSGPGNVTFGNANTLNTTASFSAAGAYVLRLTANDSALSSSDDISITVNPANQAPVVNAGSDQTITLPSNATLAGTVTDDGLPNPPNVVTTVWSMVSGPGNVGFGNANSVNTTASFSAAGTYVLRLTASDSALSNSDDVTITISAAGSTNQAPGVSAGPDQTITLPASVALNGTVADDGLPNPPNAVTTTWTLVSGPGTVSFTNANSANTSASFSAAGVYVLQLMADDSALSSSDTVTVTVNDAGLVSISSGMPPATVNLTSEGVSDWAHWGLTTATSFNHKSGVTQQISNFTTVGTGSVNRVNANSVAYSWTGGTPTPTATNTATGVWRSGVNNGFQVTAPADTVTKTLKLYVGLWKARGRLEVSLSDNSAPVYIDTSLDNNTGTSVRIYTISYRAGSSGRQLKIKWTMLTSYDPFGNITLQAAAL